MNISQDVWRELSRNGFEAWRSDYPLIVTKNYSDSRTKTSDRIVWEFVYQGGQWILAVVEAHQANPYVCRNFVVPPHPDSEGIIEDNKNIEHAEDDTTFILKTLNGYE